MADICSSTLRNRKEAMPSYDYIFGKGQRPGRFRMTSKELNTLRQVDIPLQTARGLESGKDKRIFSHSGSYTIYIGYGFDSSDESQIFGACNVNIR
jgi:hypothetical protein